MKKIIPPSANTKRLFALNLILQTELVLYMKTGVDLKFFEKKVYSRTRQLTDIFKVKAGMVNYNIVMKEVSEELSDTSYDIKLPTSLLIYSLLSLVSTHQLKQYWQILPIELQEYSREVELNKLDSDTIDKLIIFVTNISKRFNYTPKLYSTIIFTKKPKVKKLRDKPKKSKNTFHSEVRSNRKAKYAKKRQERDKRVSSILKSIIANAKGKTNE